MAMLVDWVRRVLEPRYQIDEEVARGGMGAVFRGRDPRLDRAVAIKVLLPNLATAGTAARFLREARALARLQHPHVVPVHEVDEAAGLFYYVMDFIEGPTLAQRLERGPLPPDEALKLGRDLLDALEAVHVQGFVHRDVKPSNIFLLPDRAVLTDFGIVKATADRGEGATSAGVVLGTRGYMPPEQLATGKTSVQTDLYAASMVVYEALTGRTWPVGIMPAEADWSGVPRRHVTVLSRGLRIDPKERWPDAGAFRRNLWQTRVRRYQARTALLTAAGLAAGALIFGIPQWNRPRPLPREGLIIRLAIPTYHGPAEEAWLIDSVPEVYARLMASVPDFRVCKPRAACPAPTITLRSQITVDDAMVRLLVEHEDAGHIGQVYRGTARPLGEWAQEVDRATDAGLRIIWNANSPLRDWLPLAALPEGNAGYEAWFFAEHLLNQAQWGAALGAFKQAVAIDSTCVLCAWRITEIQRWLVEPPDVTYLLRTRRAIDLFPPHYQALIRIRWLPLDERLDALENATERWPGFPYTWFLFGEELFHRGPLSGRSPTEAVAAFQRTTQLDPTFGPAWEHLAWTSIAAGNVQMARDALAAYDALEHSLFEDDYTVIIRALMGLGFTWRFAPGEARQFSETLLRNPQIAHYADIGAGPRLLATFDSRTGMIGVAQLLLANGQLSPSVHYSAHVAMVLAFVAQGRVTEARELLREMALKYPERRSLPLFALKLDATLSLVDPPSAPLDRTTLIRLLAPYGKSDSPLPGATGAGWLSALLKVQAGEALTHDVSSLPEPLAVLLDAAALRDPEAALTATAPDRLPLLAETLTETPRLEFRRLPDPFYRTILRFSRAGWHEQAGDPIAAADDLLFHAAWDLAGRPIGLPEAGEIDWAFGTFARWRRGTLLDGTQQTGEACRDLQVVAARWVEGDSLFRIRADSAGRALTRLGCEGAPPRLTW